MKHFGIQVRDGIACGERHCLSSFPPSLLVWIESLNLGRFELLVPEDIIAAPDVLVRRVDVDTQRRPPMCD